MTSVTEFPAHAAKIARVSFNYSCFDEFDLYCEKCYNFGNAWQTVVVYTDYEID